MSKELKSISEVQEYINEVEKKAQHHAPNVAKVLYKCLGVVISKSERIIVLTRNCEMKNVAWATIKGMW